MRVPDCTSESCINVLRQFFSYRGSPQLNISDNGKYFTSKDAQNFVNSSNIRWKFCIEGVPWTGVFYERLILSVKSSFQKKSYIMRS